MYHTLQTCNIYHLDVFYQRHIATSRFFIFYDMRAIFESLPLIEEFSRFDSRNNIEH